MNKIDTKLRSALQLASERLKILQAKHREFSNRYKLETANCLTNGKYLTARIKARNVIREDAAVEALELVEAYCGEIISRYNLLQLKKEPDLSLITPISSLIWVAPYYQTDVKELKDALKQFNSKYGYKFCRSSLENSNKMVSQELIDRVRFPTPSEERIDKCLKRVCRKYQIVLKESITNFKQKHKLDSGRNCEIQQKIDGSPDAFLAKGQNGMLNESTEFQAEGSGEISNSISSKKAFSKLISKMKRLKSGSRFQDKNRKKTPGDNVTASTRSNDQLNNVQNNAGSSISVMQNKSNDNSKVLTNSEKENRRVNSCSSLSQDESNGSSCGNSACKLPAPFYFMPQTFSDFCRPYLDPPPPYGAVSGPERMEARESYPLLQPPTCPLEIPDNEASGETKNKDKLSEKEM